MKGWICTTEWWHAEDNCCHFLEGQTFFRTMITFMWSFRHDFLCPLFWQAQGEQFTFLHCTAWCIQVVNVVKMPGGWLCISIVVNISHCNFAIFPCFVQKSIIGYPYWDASPKPCMHFSRLQVFSVGNYNIICYFLMSGTFFAGETCTPVFDHLPFIL